MALSSELNRRLSSGEPLSKRLKLAENVFLSRDVSINHKEDVIVGWLCNVVLTDPTAWKSMKRLAERQLTNNSTNLGSGTKEHLVTTLETKLKLLKEDLPDEFFDYCSWVLSHPDLQQYFQTDIQRFGKFIQALLLRIKLEISLTVSGTSPPESVTKSVIVRHACITNAINSILQIHRQCSDKDKLAEVFVNFILSPLCGLGGNNFENTNRVGAEIYKCIQNILFGKERYMKYEEYTQETKEGLPSVLFSLLEQIRDEMESEDFIIMLNYLFMAVVGSYKSNAALIDSLFRRLVSLSGTMKVMAVNSLIEWLKDISLDYDNKVDGLTLMEFFCNLIDENLQSKHLKSHNYDLISQIAKLNVLIIEKKMPVIFKRVLLAPRKTDSEEKSYSHLMISTLEASSRLRREQKLIPWLLQALEATLSVNDGEFLTVPQILPIEFLTKLTLLVEGFQSAQTIAMLKSFTFHLKSNCVDKFETDNAPTVYIMAECIVQLFEAFFEGIKIYQHTVPLLLQIKFVDFLNKLRDILAELATLVVNNKGNERMIAVLLKATLSWSRVQGMLVEYSSKSGAENTIFPIPDKVLRKLTRRVNNSKNAACRTALDKLQFHRIKFNNLDEPQGKLADIIDGLEKSWAIILNDYPELVPMLTTEQLSELASLLLQEVMSEQSNVEKWSQILRHEDFAENKSFIVALLCQTLTNIGSLTEGSMTAAVTSRINIIKILEHGTNDEAGVPALESNNIINDIVVRSSPDKKSSKAIMNCLDIMLCLPLRLLDAPVKTLTYVVMYVLGRELQHNEKIGMLCDSVLLETLEKGRIDVLKFISLKLLLEQPPSRKALQESLKMIMLDKSVSPDAVDPFPSLYKCPDKVVPDVLFCIETVNPKLQNPRKSLFKHLGEKLSKKFSEMRFKSTNSTRDLILNLQKAISDDSMETELKNSVILQLRSIFQAEAEDSHDGSDDQKANLIKEKIQLATLALHEKCRLDLSEDLITDIGTWIICNPEKKLLGRYIEGRTPQEYKKFLYALNERTEKYLELNDKNKLKTIFVVWRYILENNVPNSKHKHRLEEIRKLLMSMHRFDITTECWSDLLNVLRVMIDSKQLELPSSYIDLMILVVGKTLREFGLPVCNDIALLCLSLLKSRIEIMMDKLPQLLNLYEQIIRILAREAKKECTEDIFQLGNCALSIEKITSSLVKLKKDLSRLTPYIIADIIEVFNEAELQPCVKVPFENCVRHLLSVNDPHGVNFLHRNLPASKREKCKAFIESYNKEFKFTGKI